jgi:hypothetical protein
MTHTVTEKTKTEVTALKSFGNTNEDIANYLGIHHETLTKHYKYELDSAQVRVNFEVAKSLYNKAINGDIAAIIFWLKTRARWRTGDNKRMLDSNEDLSSELKALREMLDRQNKRDY